MKIEIEIPEEFEVDYTADKFAEFLDRVRADIDYNGICGNYEREIADVLAEAFKNSRVVQPVAYKGVRLIDEEDVISLLSNHHFDKDKENFDLLIHNLCKEVKGIPTAYDVDVVVEQLEEIKKKNTEIALDDLQEERCFWYKQGMDKAIKIVKGGGADAIRSVGKRE